MKIKDLIKQAALAESKAQNGFKLDLSPELAAFMGAFREETLSDFDLKAIENFLLDDFETDRD